MDGERKIPTFVKEDEVMGSLTIMRLPCKVLVGLTPSTTVYKLHTYSGQL